MEIRDGLVGSIGNTPLVKLRCASEMTGCTPIGSSVLRPVAAWPRNLMSDLKSDDVGDFGRGD